MTLDASPLVWIVVLSWLALTVAANLPQVGTRLRLYDPLDLLPAWTFFAPNPGVVDPALFVQDIFPDDTTSPWRVAWIERPSRFRPVWRPGKRTAKLVSDCTSTVRVAAAMEDETLTAAFLILASVAAVRGHEGGAVQYRFGIADVYRWWERDRHPTMVYISPPIALTRNSEAR